MKHRALTKRRLLIAMAACEITLVALDVWVLVTGRRPRP